ncbi:MAG: DegV family protein [Dehalococcoidia bacterium]|nr:DegV family protein [Dehalococcoidia bacterium]
MPVHVVTDSTCDLPADLAREHGITVVPLTVSFGDESFLDGVDIDADEFYRRLAASSGLPRTSQPSVERFRQVYASFGPGAEIVSVHLSARLSGTLNSATIAREQLADDARIELLDSNTVSLGLGAVAVEAAFVARQGGTLEEVSAAARRTIERVQVIALVDTLEYLRRGGRIGRARSMLGSLLSIKPLVHVEDGEVAPLERVRTRGRAIERLFELATADPTARRVFVGSGGNREEAEVFLERLRRALPDTELLLGQVGPVVGVHAGPNVLGVAIERGN